MYVDVACLPIYTLQMVKMNPPSASAAKDEVKDCFELFDVNGNGVVTTTGFTDTLMRLGQEASEEEAKEMMAMMKKISGKANKYASNSKTNKDTESLNLKDFQNLYASLPQ